MSSETSLKSYRVIAEELFHLAFRNSNEFAEMLRTNECAKLIVRQALSAYMQEGHDEPKSVEDEGLSTFLAHLSPQPSLSCREIALDEVPDQIMEEFGRAYAVRAWSYHLSLKDKHVEGYCLAGKNFTAEEPVVQDIMRDILIGDMGGDATSPQDTERLETLFPGEQARYLRRFINWEE